MRTEGVVFKMADFQSSGYNSAKLSLFQRQECALIFQVRPEGSTLNLYPTDDWFPELVRLHGIPYKGHTHRL